MVQILLVVLATLIFGLSVQVRNLSKEIKELKKMSALIPINNVNVAFEVVNDEVFATSLQIAEVFEKNHPEILRLIRSLPVDDFMAQNFKESSYLNKQNRKQPCYNLTRDGFSLLVMGFTGEKAYKWKVEFIKAFNMMEAGLKRQSVSRYINQINGYKSQIAQHNEQIAKLKRELVISRPEIVYSAEVIEKQEAKLESLKALLHNARCERDYYFKRCDELKAKQRFKDDEITRLLKKICVQMDGVYSEIGAVMAYCYDDDRYFIENNEILKGDKYV